MPHTTRKTSHLVFRHSLCQHNMTANCWAAKAATHTLWPGLARSSPRRCGQLSSKEAVSLSSMCYLLCLCMGPASLAGCRLPLGNCSSKLTNRIGGPVQRLAPAAMAVITVSARGVPRRAAHAVQTILAASITSQVAQMPILPALCQATRPGLHLSLPSCLRSWQHPTAYAGKLLPAFEQPALPLRCCLGTTCRPACLQTCVTAPAADPQLQLEQG